MDDGCLCQGCNTRYKVDVLVPNELWYWIKPKDDGGLLCGSCIMNRIEAMGEFGAYKLEKI